MHLEKSRGNGAKKSPARPVWTKAHQQLSASLPPASTRDRGRKKMTFWHYGPVETNQTHVTLVFRMYCTYRGIQNSQKALSLPLSEWWKGCSPRGERMARGTDVSLVISLSISPVEAAQTPLGCTETSGKNCQWDLYSTRRNKKWISLPRYKHKWPEPWCICLDPPPPPPTPPPYLCLPHSPSHVLLLSSMHSLSNVHNCKAVLWIVWIRR